MLYEMCKAVVFSWLFEHSVALDLHIFSAGWKTTAAGTSEHKCHTKQITILCFKSDVRVNPIWDKYRWSVEFDLGKKKENWQ